MNGLNNREVLEQLNRDAHKRLIREAAEARRVHKPGLLLRLFGKKARKRRNAVLEALQIKETSIQVKPVRPHSVTKTAG